MWAFLLSSGSTATAAPTTAKPLVLSGPPVAVVAIDYDGCVTGALGLLSDRLALDETLGYDKSSEVSLTRALQGIFRKHASSIYYSSGRLSPDKKDKFVSDIQLAVAGFCKPAIQARLAGVTAAELTAHALESLAKEVLNTDLATLAAREAATPADADDGVAETKDDDGDAVGGAGAASAAMPATAAAVATSVTGTATTLIGRIADIFAESQKSQSSARKSPKEQAAEAQAATDMEEAKATVKAVVRESILFYHAQQTQATKYVEIKTAYIATVKACLIEFHAEFSKFLASDGFKVIQTAIEIEILRCRNQQATLEEALKARPDRIELKFELSLAALALKEAEQKQANLRHIITSYQNLCADPDTYLEAKFPVNYFYGFDEFDDEAQEKAKRDITRIISENFDSYIQRTSGQQIINEDQPRDFLLDRLKELPRTHSLNTLNAVLYTRANPLLLSYIQRHTLSATTVILMNGSNRQSAAVDAQNASNGTGSCFVTLRALKRKLDQLAVASLRETVKALSAGETAEVAFERLAREHSPYMLHPMLMADFPIELGEHTAVRADDDSHFTGSSWHHIRHRLDGADRGHLFDDSKLLTTYAQIHHQAALHPTSRITYQLIDDKADPILLNLMLFFNMYPEMLPQNVSLTLVHYCGTESPKPIEFLSKARVLIPSTIQGTGVIDLDFPTTLGALVNLTPLDDRIGDDDRGYSLNKNFSLAKYLLGTKQKPQITAILKARNTHSVADLAAMTVTAPPRPVAAFAAAAGAGGGAHAGGRTSAHTAAAGAGGRGGPATTTTMAP